jgi:hypothetical protein
MEYVTVSPVLKTDALAVFVRDEGNGVGVGSIEHVIVTLLAADTGDSLSALTKAILSA